ncbi:MAG: DUF2849 domain-containing protein [Rhodospirillales bacterium]|nr:DUF2849 domain-containing protein [Rhodospirillales bacterium]
MTTDTLQALTANRLIDGLVVYLTETGEWSTRVDDAALVPAETGEIVLAATGEQAVSTNHVVAPYLIDVETGGGEVNPTRFRERIRAFGPTVNTSV